MSDTVVVYMYRNLAVLWCVVTHAHSYFIAYSFFHSLPAATVVGLERTFFSVSEDVGVVELCAGVYFPVIDCPIAFPFDVRLSTRNDTAGN